MNIARSVEVASLYFPDKPALIFEDKTYTYQELNQQVNRLANALEALGLEKGDRVGLFLPNIPSFVIGYYAAQKLGAIVVSVNSMSKKREVQVHCQRFRVQDTPHDLANCVKRSPPMSCPR